MRKLGILAAFLLLGACGDDGGGDGNPNTIDGAPGASDADPNAPDADPNGPDARVGPDAMPNTVMSFFVTSVGNGANGGNLGGLVGADAKCQNLATNAGAGARTWRAYLSTDAPLVNAKDRIGIGPWANQAGVEVAANVAALHTNGIPGPMILDELGQLVPQPPNHDHDILTGSTSDGNLAAGKTCNNWTNGTASRGGQVGHADDDDGSSWNSSHDPQCSEEALASTAGTGRIYCFAVNL